VALVDNLEALLAKGQDNALLRFGLGQEHFKAKAYDKAVEHLQKSLIHNPSYSAAWKLLGQALALTGRVEEAIKTYEDGIRAAEEKGDKQAAKEMTVFLKRLQK
jgi:tetratricopeptide (TPR) repeat protein